ncbi:MAG TPA: hypothetical protein VHE83_04740 [Mycobacteriales bacterium]|nr:hypothetical protein [Mycobacteriales bacterium]
MHRLIRFPVAAVAAAAALSACSAGGNGGGPSAVSQTSAPAGSDSPSPSAGASDSASPSASPTPAAPVARLAYATPTAVFVVGLGANGQPTSPPQPVSDTIAAGPGAGMSDLQWSRNGRYLSWSQLAPGVEGIAYGLYDSSTGKHVVISGPSNGAAVATTTDMGLLMMTDTRVTPYDGTGRPGAARTVRFQGQVVNLDTPDDGQLLASVAGAEPGGLLLTVGTGATAHLVEVNGAGTAIDLGSLADPQDAPLVNGAAGRDGYIAAEQGDHTDGCGVPPASVVLVVAPGTPATQIALPASPAGAIERAINLTVSTDHVVGATLVACGNGQGAGYPTDFAELHGTGWQVVANDALAASRGPGGLLAYVHARIGGEGEKYGPRGDQHLKIVTKGGTQGADLGGPVTAVLFAPGSAPAPASASPSTSASP